MHMSAQSRKYTYHIPGRYMVLLSKIYDKASCPVYRCSASTKYKLERVGCPQPQSCPPAWEQDEMLINEWGKCDITSYYLHVKSGDDSLNGIAVISRTIFVENWLWRPSCFSEIAEIQYQPSLCHLISV